VGNLGTAGIWGRNLRNLDGIWGRNLGGRNLGTDGTESGDRRDVPHLFAPASGISAHKNATGVGGHNQLWYFLSMARLPRIVIADVPHHVTQRGNARQVILASDADRMTYLELMREYSQLYGLSLLGYCLMSNHVHLIAVPRTSEALSQSLKQAHGRYASYWNALRSSTGHVWQGRFYSCPLDESHLWAALRYVELNPVRAGITANAQHMEMVECGDPLCSDELRPAARHGTVEGAMDPDRVGSVSRRDGIDCRCEVPATIHAHGPAVGKWRIRRFTGATDLASPRPAERRPTQETTWRSSPAQLYLDCLADKPGNVPSVPGFHGIKSHRLFVAAGNVVQCRRRRPKGWSPARRGLVV
jgi:REP element-mobilizing transposase RayT